MACYCIAYCDAAPARNLGVRTSTMYFSETLSPKRLNPKPQNPKPFQLGSFDFKALGPSVSEKLRRVQAGFRDSSQGLLKGSWDLGLSLTSQGSLRVL